MSRLKATHIKTWGDRERTADFMTTLVRVGILPYNTARFPDSLIKTIKALRAFSASMYRLELHEKPWGLKDAKEYTEKHWPHRWIWFVKRL